MRSMMLIVEGVGTVQAETVNAGLEPLQFNIDLPSDFFNREQIGDLYKSIGDLIRWWDEEVGYVKA